MQKLILSLIILCCFFPYTKAESIKSPDGNVQLNFSINNGIPVYQINYKGHSIIKESKLGLELKDQDNLLSDFKVIQTESSTFEEKWKPVWGEEDEIYNHYNEICIHLKQSSTNRFMNLRFRVYNEGIGFRYEFPEQEKLTYFIVKEEHSQFAMTGDHTAFWIPGDYDTQEYDYTESKLSEIRSLLSKAIVPNASQTPFSPTGVQTSLLMRISS